MKRLSFSALLGLVVLLVAGFVWYGNRDRGVDVSNFVECAESGYPVMESYPRKCSTYDGKTFVEDIGNELEKADVIRIFEPRPNTSMSSPLTVSGEARGGWYFEGSFPVKLYDSEGEQIASGLAQSQGEWTTTEFVEFEAKLTFSVPPSGMGTLVLEKDNPSGLPENDDQLVVPVRFAE